ncbi:MAG: diacylglycerol kinase family lipid kinase [Mycoplasma sp.]|nr:diacylglycerol kinase family lipid kinase [Candidatus Hennigella equi]
MNEIHLICNPTSGKGKTLTTLDRIKEWLNANPKLNVQIHLTENVGHATSLARDLTKGDNKVTLLVLGGDGTVNEVLNGIVNFKTTHLGILPFGSGNDFVRALKIINPDPIDLMKAYLSNPKVMNVDYLLLNDKYRAINEIGLGMSAEVINYRNKMKHFSPETQYKIASTVRALFWKSFTYNLSIDKNPSSKINSMWFTMNNGIAVGSGMVTAPDAKIDDGLISVSFVKKFNRLKTLSLLMKCKKGKMAYMKETGRFTCKEIDIDTDIDTVVEFDGNLLEHQKHINVKIVPQELKLLVVEK